MNATVVSQKITAIVSPSGAVTASVAPYTAISSAVSGGVGPQGPSGVSTIGAAQDVQLSGLADGDLLRYSTSTSKWLNVNQNNILDGGNFLLLVSLFIGGA